MIYHSASWKAGLRQMKLLPKTLWLCTMIILLTVIIVFPSYAGNGDGSGGGQGAPLALVSSYPANGQKDVALPVEIKLSFSKNVINMSVKDNNQKCFSLQSSDGKVIPVEVIMADDQIEPEKKRDVLIKPVQKLNPGTGYTVKIAAGLMSKSGVTLGKIVTVNFETKAESVSSVSEKSDPVDANSQVAGNTEKSAENTAVQKTSRSLNNTSSPDAAVKGSNENVTGDGSAAKTTIRNTEGTKQDAESIIKETEGTIQENEDNKQDVKETADNQQAAMEEENKQNEKSNLVLPLLGLAILLAALFALIKRKGKQY